MNLGYLTSKNTRSKFRNRPAPLSLLLMLTLGITSLTSVQGASASNDLPSVIYQGHANSAASPHNSGWPFRDLVFGTNGYELYANQYISGIEKLDTRSLIPGDLTTGTFTNFDVNLETSTQSSALALSSDGQYAYASGGNSSCAIIKFNLLISTTSCVGPVGTGGWPNLELSPDNSFIYVVKDGQAVYKVDTTTDQVVGEILNPDFYGISTVISGSSMYLFNEFTGHMYEINTVTFQQIGDYTIGSGVAPSRHMSKVGNIIYLGTSSASQGYIVKFDVTTHTTSRIEVNMGALNTIYIYGLKVTPDGKFGWFMDNDNGKVRQVSLTGSSAGTILFSTVMPSSDNGRELVINSTQTLVAYSSSQGGQWLTIIATQADQSTDPVSDTPSSVSSPAIDSAIAIKAAEDAHARVVAAAKAEIKSVLTSGKPLTANQLLDADFNGVTAKNIGLVNADIAKLPDADKTDLKQIEKVVLKFATVDKVAEGKTVYSSDLIAVGLIPQDSKIKTSITSALRKLPGSSLDTFEKIQAAVASVEKMAADRKARLAAILGKRN